MEVDMAILSYAHIPCDELHDPVLAVCSMEACPGPNVPYVLFLSCAPSMSPCCCCTLTSLWGKGGNVTTTLGLLGYFPRLVTTLINQ